MIEQRDPNTLIPHPEVAQFPRWDHDSDGFRGFCNDIREHGIRHPIQITPDGIVLDGETRRQAAIEVGLVFVPVVLVPENESFTVIVRELVQRRNLTQSAKAFWGYHLFAEAHMEARARRRDGLKKGQNSPSGTECQTGNIGEFANFLGISERLFRHAAKVHEIFEKDPEYRAQMLPEINEHGIGLGAVVAGYAGQEATKGKARLEYDDADLFSRSLRSTFIRVVKLPDPRLIRSTVETLIGAVEDSVDLDKILVLADELRSQVKSRLSQGLK
jgi:hypothetical protein